MEPGPIELSAGSSSDVLRSKANLTVTGKTRLIKGEDRKFLSVLRWAHQARAAADSEPACLVSSTRLPAQQFSPVLQQRDRKSALLIRIPPHEKTLPICGYVVRRGREWKLVVRTGEPEWLLPMAAVRVGHRHYLAGGRLNIKELAAVGSPSSAPASVCRDAVFFNRRRKPSNPDFGRASLVGDKRNPTSIRRNFATICLLVREQSGRRSAVAA